MLDTQHHKYVPVTVLKCAIMETERYDDISCKKF